MLNHRHQGATDLGEDLHCINMTTIVRERSL
jgi:hypothetical protein